MPDLYSVVHREIGPLATFANYDEAVLELERVFWDEPTWLPDLWIEPFDLVVADGVEQE